MKRTHLPLNALRVLDAAARHLSFTRAADELAVTPAAVGQQVRALEDTLGVVLFRRTAKGLELTPEAAAGLGALRDGFLQFEEAVRAIQSGQTSKTLTIAAPRDLTARWLGARLAAYGRTDPELRFVLIASDDELDFTQANLDLAIRLADGPGEHEGAPLGEAGFATVALPDAPDRTIAWPGHAGDAGADEAAAGPAPGAGIVVTVADAGLAIDAAAQGFGRATVPAFLVTGAIAPLVMTGQVASPLGYWLIAPVPQWRQRKVKALVAALLG